MGGVLPYLIALFLSLGIVCAVHPYLVRLALKRGIVDNPNARKLNRIPVPVLGGVGVFTGFVIALYVISLIMGVSLPKIYIVLLLLMVGVGFVDDLYDLKPSVKFIVQIVAALLLYFVCGLRIDSLHGIFGIYELPVMVSLPLTLVACVGLINALNLIDGIDGLSSGYSMVAASLFAVWTSMQGGCVNLLVACALVGALIPFFVYNVFGKRNKMFIGDAGSYLLGIIFCVMMLDVLDSASYSEVVEVALVPFVFAVFSFPVMDTLRVMTMRICRGCSPFKADKTHLHHALVGRGLSHLVTTLVIIGLNLLVVGAWFVCCRCMLPASAQMGVVLGVALLCIVLPYFLLRKKHR